MREPPGRGTSRTVTSDPPDLSLSHWRAARQCMRRLWLERHAPEGAAGPDPELAASVALRAALAERARARFPGGVVADGSGAAGIARTRVLLADASVPAVFDAVVAAGGLRVRVDVLVRRADGRFDVHAVQAATAVRPDHLDDLALRVHGLEASGTAVATVAVLHVDRDQVRDDAPLPIDRLLRAVDVTEEVRARVAGVTERLRALHAELALPEAPRVAPSPHCSRPHRCPFWDACTAALPDDAIVTLPRLAANQYAALRDAGIARIGEIPDAWWLTGPQARARQALRAGRAVRSDDLAAALTPTGPPAGHLDFETISPAEPLFPGTRPYEVVPFQWSFDRVDAHGAVAHAEFLADGPGDPRPAFVETLLDATRGAGPILVYSGYEAGVLESLARAFPARAAALAALRGRLVDLLAIVLDHVYHPGFAGSFSLKRVAPALAPELAWGAGGGFAGGREASEAFLALRGGTLEPDEAARLRRELLAYCATDTRALVVLHRALRALASR